MREKTKKLSSILLCLVFCFSFSTAVYAASYIYYDGGLKSATVDVENRLSNSSVYKNSVSAWYRQDHRPGTRENKHWQLHNNY